MLQIRIARSFRFRKFDSNPSNKVENPVITCRGRDDNDRDNDDDVDDGYAGPVFLEIFRTRRTLHF